jgi:hypothetical protein
VPAVERGAVARPVLRGGADAADGAAAAPGLLLYAPLAPTTELRATLAALEQLHGPVITILLPTSSGLEHKLPVPALAQFSLSADIPGQVMGNALEWGIGPMHRANASL